LGSVQSAYGAKKERMKIDLHVHTAERSACALSGEEEMIEAAIAQGLDALAITDHDRLVPPQRLAELNRKFAPFRIFGGIEVDLNMEHVVVLGIQDPELERRWWDWPALHGFVREREGLLILAHPFRFFDTVTIDVEAYPPDAIETNSTNMSNCDPSRIRDLADRLGLHRVANSDAHWSRHVGVFYNLLERPAGEESELVEILRAGASRPCRMEHRIDAINSAGGYLRNET